MKRILSIYNIGFQFVFIPIIIIYFISKMGKIIELAKFIQEHGSDFDSTKNAVENLFSDYYKISPPAILKFLLSSIIWYILYKHFIV